MENPHNKVSTFLSNTYIEYQCKYKACLYYSILIHFDGVLNGHFRKMIFRKAKFSRQKLVPYYQWCHKFKNTDLIYLLKLVSESVNNVVVDAPDFEPLDTIFSISNMERPLSLSVLISGSCDNMPL